MGVFFVWLLVLLVRYPGLARASGFGRLDWCIGV